MNPFLSYGNLFMQEFFDKHLEKEKGITGNKSLLVLAISCLSIMREKSYYDDIHKMIKAIEVAIQK